MSGVNKVVHLADNVVIIHGDSTDPEVLPWLQPASCVVLDPPFDIWQACPAFTNPTRVCFTTWQHRRVVEDLFGHPRCEVIWHFKDGRWVSHKLPRFTHESILVYGPTSDVYVGEINEDRTPKKKGRGCVGRDKTLAERYWVPRERKALNSVIEITRNVRGMLGCWSKPVALMDLLMRWVTPRGVADPFMGGASCGVACIQNGIPYVGVEAKEEYFDLARGRLETELSRATTVSSGGEG